jgi:hypothetical protein
MNTLPVTRCCILRGRRGGKFLLQFELNVADHLDSLTVRMNEFIGTVFCDAYIQSVSVDFRRIQAVVLMIA